MVFFGDSICVGQYVTVHRGWVSRLSERLEGVASRGGASLCVVNASINGNTTRLALERMPQDVQKDGVDLMVVQFGLNDCNYWLTDEGLPRVSPEAFAANLTEIVRRGFACGAKRILLNNNHPTARDQESLRLLGQPYERSNERYNDITRTIARGLGDRVIFTDVEMAFHQRTGGRRERLLELLQPAPDLLHLSEAGHDLYLEIVGPTLERALSEVLREVISARPMQAPLQ